MFAAASLAAAALAAYAFEEARHCRLTRVRLALPNIPLPFVGLTIALLSDTHHGPFVTLDYLASVVAMTNALEPDVIALGGDYTQRQRSYQRGVNNAHFIAPGIAVLGGLRAKLGRFAVLGNHDRRLSTIKTRRALAKAGLQELTNTGVWLERGGARLRFCGVDDWSTGQPDLRAALGDAQADDAVILLAHNPDYVQRIRDRRVGLVLSGHTHGGQVVLPLIGAPYVPSRYGQKYRSGLVQGPVARVFVTRGVGTIVPPVRLGCPPEVVFITLV